MNFLNTCTSLATRKKLACANITFEIFLEPYNKNKLLGIKELLGNNENKQTRVTKSKSVINKLFQFFEKNKLRSY